MKNFVKLVLFLFACSSTQASAEPKNLEINNFIEAVLVFIRNGMSNGWPILGIPPLDPLKIPPVEFDFDLGYFSLKGGVNNTEISKLSKFDIMHIGSNGFHMSASFSLSLLEVDITGDYDVQGEILNTYHVKGKGPYSIIGKDINFRTEFELGLTTCNFKPVIQIKDLNLDLKLRETEVEFTGIHTEDMSPDFINDALSMFGPEIFQALTDRYLPIIERRIMNFINHILSPGIPLM